MRRYYNGEKNRARLYEAVNKTKHVITGDNTKERWNSRGRIFNDREISQIKLLILNGCYKTPTKFYYDIIVDLITIESELVEEEWRIKV